MGDIFYLKLKCAGCGAENPSNEDYEADPMENAVYYAPSSGFMHFTCRVCKKLNWIETGYHARAVDKKELEELYKENGFE